MLSICALVAVCGLRWCVCVLPARGCFSWLLCCVDVVDFVLLLFVWCVGCEFAGGLWLCYGWVGLVLVVWFVLFAC